MSVRETILRGLYGLFPFDLRGDLELREPEDRDDTPALSCVINFYGRPEVLKTVLHSLAGQDMPRDRFEVVVVEDRGGTPEGASAVEGFSGALNIVYRPQPEGHGRMGFARNFALSLTRGEHILLLDDDTVIIQEDFLSTLLGVFGDTGAAVVMPRGYASFCTIEGRYQYHDPFFPTSRCTAYTRAVLGEMGGFVSDMVGQEDVEMVVRLTAAHKALYECPELEYMHPPLLLDGLAKPAAVGASFWGLRKRYPFPVWLMIIANGMRFLPMLTFPFSKRCLMHGRFSLGFALGIIYSAVGRETHYS